MTSTLSTPEIIHCPNGAVFISNPELPPLSPHLVMEACKKLPPQTEVSLISPTLVFVFLAVIVVLFIASRFISITKWCQCRKGYQRGRESDIPPPEGIQTTTTPVKEI